MLNGLLGFVTQRYPAMDNRILRSFTIVASQFNITRAAASLFISQSALSRQMKDLEQELNVSLFVRSAHGVALTEAGKKLLPVAHEILEKNRQAGQLMEAFRPKPALSLTIGYMPMTMEGFLAELLKKFKQEFPAVKVILQEMAAGEQMEALRAGKIELAFLGNPDDLEGEFNIQSLKCSPMAVVLPKYHPCATAKPIDLKLLAEETFIGLSETKCPGGNESIRKVCEKAGFQAELLTHADGFNSVFGLIAAGQGISIMPSEMETISHQDLVFVALRRPVVYIQSAAVWRKEEPTTALHSIIKIFPPEVEHYFGGGTRQFPSRDQK